jgi:prepilin-type N-terminal cleavage/methylation domain-containing protein
VRLATPAALRDERGFTLVELIIVMFVVGILMLMALTSYRGYRDRANDSTAKENVYTLLPAISVYFVDHESYENMTLAELKSDYNAGINVSKYSFGSVVPTDETYCIQSSSGDRTWRKYGPHAPLERQACP